MLTKLSAIKIPDIMKVHCLCRDSVTSQGVKERNDATDAPSPKRTSKDGRAQQRSVPTDVNREK